MQNDLIKDFEELVFNLNSIYLKLGQRSSYCLDRDADAVFKQEFYKLLYKYCPELNRRKGRFDAKLKNYFDQIHCHVHLKNNTVDWVDLVVSHQEFNRFGFHHTIIRDIVKDILYKIPYKAIALDSLSKNNIEAKTVEGVNFGSINQIKFVI